MVDFPNSNHAEFINVDLTEESAPSNPPSNPPPQMNYGRCFKHFATKENICMSITGLFSIGLGVGLEYLIITSMTDKNIKPNLQIKTSEILGAFVALAIAGVGTCLIVNSVRQAINQTRQEIEPAHEERQPLLD